MFIRMTNIYCISVSRVLHNFWWLCHLLSSVCHFIRLSIAKQVYSIISDESITGDWKLHSWFSQGVNLLLCLSGRKITSLQFRTTDILASACVNAFTLSSRTCLFDVAFNPSPTGIIRHTPKQCIYALRRLFPSFNFSDNFLPLRLANIRYFRP